MLSGQRLRKEEEEVLANVGSGFVGRTMTVLQIKSQVQFEVTRAACLCEVQRTSGRLAKP